MIPLVSAALPEETALSIELELDKSVVHPGESLKFKIDLTNHLTGQEYPVQLYIRIQDTEEIWFYETNVYLRTSSSILKNALIKKSIEPGNYNLHVSAEYLGLTSEKSAVFKVEVPWYLKDVEKPVKVWHTILFVIVLGIVLIVIKYTRTSKQPGLKKQENQKQEKDYKTRGW